MEFIQPDPIGWEVTHEGKVGMVISYPEVLVIDNKVGGYCMVLWGEGTDRHLAYHEVSDLKPVMKDPDGATLMTLVNPEDVH